MKGSIRQRSAGTTLLAGVAASTLTWPLAHALATGSGAPASTSAHTVTPWAYREGFYEASFTKQR